MEGDNYKKFIKAELKEMKKYRDQKNKEAEKDLGQQPVIEWINKQSKSFREKWNLKNKGG